MSTIRRKYSEEYIIEVIVVNKNLYKVTAIAVNYKETLVSPSTRFLLRAAVKNLL